LAEAIDPVLVALAGLLAAALEDLAAGRIDQQTDLVASPQSLGREFQAGGRRGRCQQLVLARRHQTRRHGGVVGLFDADPDGHRLEQLGRFQVGGGPAGPGGVQVRRVIVRVRRRDAAEQQQTRCEHAGGRAHGAGPPTGEKGALHGPS
jgi:hypothetical protein